MQEIEAPRTKEALAEALRRQHREIEAYFASFPTAEFLAPQGEHWSPEGHLRHLVKCVRPLGRVLSLPKVALLLRFGPRLGKAGKNGPSRSFEEMRDAYRKKLDEGAQAGPWGPSPRGDTGTPEKRRERVLGRWKEGAEVFERALPRWGDGALDRLRVPHPVLGKLTVREMLFWDLYHNHHHLSRVRERAAAGEDGETLQF